MQSTTSGAVHLLQILLDLALGALLGFLGGLFGIGGGIIAIPILSLLFGMDQHLAQGTTLVMVVPNVMLGLWRYYKRGGVNVGYAVVLGSSAVAVTYVAAKFAIGLLAPTLRMAFGLFITAVAVYLVFQVWRKRAKQRQAPAEANGTANAGEQHPAPGWAVFVGAAGGMLSGMFGVGGATIAPPMLTTFYGFSQAGAQGLALALVAPGSIVGLAAYAQAGAVNWPQGLALAAGGLLFVSRGVALAYKLSNDMLKLSFAALLVVSAGMLIVAAR
jgi:uncharacterized membrane protein YfcA